MRVLCLHGMGTNAGIFETQTEIFRGLLPKHFEYEFFDAEHEISAADSVGDIFPGPYTCWYPVPTITNVKSAHQVVWDIIEEEGPFDVVMGFSQGAALAASVLLSHQIERPFSTPPFKLAIFICGSLPYCTDNARGVDVARLFSEPSPTGFGPPKYISYQPTNDDGSAAPRPLYNVQKDTSSELHDLVRSFKLSSLKNDDWDQIPVDPGMTPDASSDSDSVSVSDREDASPLFSPISDRSGTSTSLSSDEDDQGFSWMPSKPTMEGPLDHVIRRYHADVDQVTIGIPTAHVYGAKDPYYQQSRELERLCDPQWTSAYEHSDGHLVPRSSSVNQGIAAAIEKALAATEICAR